MRKKTKADTLAEKNAVYFAQTAKDIEQETTMINEISGMGERYMALANMQQKIRDLIKNVGKNMNQQVEISSPREAYSVLALTGTAVGGLILSMGGLLVGIIGGPVLIPICIGGTIMGVGIGTDGIVSSKTETARQKISDGAADFLKNMATLERKIDEQNAAILLNHLDSLAASPCFDKLYDNYPAVKDAFIKASAKASVLPSITRLDKPSSPAPKGV